MNSILSFLDGLLSLTPRNIYLKSIVIFLFLSFVKFIWDSVEEEAGEFTTVAGKILGLSMSVTKYAL